jgi:hypothetical protein
MIAYFDDTLGSPAVRPHSPVNPDAVAGALELCIAARDCLILASKTVAQLSRSAAEIGDLECVEELRQLRSVLWESRAVVEARIITLRRVQSAFLAHPG